MLYYAVSALLGSGGHEAVYAAVERPLHFSQTAAVMEVDPTSVILHCYTYCCTLTLVTPTP